MLTVATWIGAIATLGLLIGAIVTVYYAKKAFGEQARSVAKQSDQLNVQRQQMRLQLAANARQARVLDLQASELRESLARLEREAAERRRAQASQVLFWDERLPADPAITSAIGYAGAAEAIDGGQHRPVAVAHVKNNSPLPVSRLEFRWHLGIVRIGQPDQLSQLLPGAEEQSTRPVDPGDGELRYEAVLTFRDAAGVTWRRTPDGSLEELPAAATAGGQ